MYFYIINNGSTVSEDRKRRKLPRSRSFTQRDFTFFSYGKQSLEVGCFYRGPFFFLGHTYHGKSKKCNWGDYRIPESDKLDNGASEFMPADEYLNNGWENYKTAWTGADIAEPVRTKARAEEARKWWQ